VPAFSAVSLSGYRLDSQRSSHQVACSSRATLITFVRPRFPVYGRDRSGCLDPSLALSVASNSLRSFTLVAIVRR